MPKFKAEIQIIGANPYVAVPEKILDFIFKKAKRSKSPIPICGIVNAKTYKQSLVKYKGDWRLYINTVMLKNSPRRIGEIIELSINFDPQDRHLNPHPKLKRALQDNPEANLVFKHLSPSRKHEIIRYISVLKKEESIERNVARAIDFLKGKGRFAGRAITPL